MRIFRKRSLRKNMTLVLMSSFFLNAPMSLLNARAAQKQAQVVMNLEFDMHASLRAILNQMIAEGNVSQDVRSCYDALKKHAAVDVDVLVRALPDIMLQVYKAKDAVVRSVKNEADLVDSNKAKDLVSALRALKAIKDNLSSMKNAEANQKSQDFQLVLQALQEMLGDMPAGNFDASEYLRFISSTNDLGIRQILVQMVGCIDTLISKVDLFEPCCTSILSKIDDCCFSLNSKLDKVDEDVLDCCATLNSKLDKVDEDILDCCATLNSKLDAIDGNFAECCNTLNSKLDKVDEDVLECCHTVNSKLDKVDEDILSCCATIDSKIDNLDSEVIECCFTINSKLDDLSTDESLFTCCSNLEQLINQVDTDVNNLVPLIQGGFANLNSNLITCCTILGSSIDQTDTIINKCCSTVNSKLDMLLTKTEAAGCEATPIYGPTTISTSGSYCLANNISSANAQTILINGSSNIVLDLNGHDVANTAGGIGIFVTGGGVNIAIANGTVTSPSFTGTGLMLSQPSSGIVVKNVSTFGWLTAASVDATTSTLQDCNFASPVSFNFSGDSSLLRCKVSSFLGDAVTATLLNRLVIKDCQIVATKAGTNCINLTNANQVYITGCAVSHVQGNGIFVGENCNGVEVVDTSAIANNNGAGTGFTVDTATGTLISNCYAAGFNVGYQSGVSTQLNIQDSVAKNCVTGFLMNGSAILRGNTADFNTNGFIGTSSQTYYSNIACNNTNNYVGISSAPITSPANARGVMNVDCSNAQTDQVADTLSTVDVIEANLVGLSFTVNSKIDDVEECCVAVNSKADIILSDLSSTQTTVGNVSDLSYDSCAFTTTASIDAASLSVISWLKTIYRDIRGFVTALPSQC